MRLPVVAPLSSRDGTSGKNARLYNALKETKPTGQDMAVVRPGLVTQANATGTGKGLVAFNGELISVYGSTIGASPVEGGSWTKVSSATMLGIGSVASNGTIAVQNAQSSTNGTTWAPISVIGTAPDESYWWIGSVLYGIRTSTPRLKKSVDNGVTWTNVSILPSGAGDAQTLWYVGSTMYLYDADAGQMWDSSDLGVTWNEIFPSSFPSVTNAVPFTVVGSTLYLFDGVNGTADVSTNYQDFTTYSLYSAGVSIGYYDSGYFYGHNFTTGDVFKVPTSDLTAHTVIGNVPPASDPMSAFYHYGQPFELAGAHYIFGLNGVYTDAAAIPSIGTVTGDHFDFCQSAL